MCCFNAGLDNGSGGDATTTDADQDSVPAPPAPTTRPLPQTAVHAVQLTGQDLPSSMDTCSPTTGIAGLCIRSDIAPMVCTPLGYEIGDQMSCAADRLCCYSATGSVPVAPALVTVTPPLFSNQPGGTSKTCQVGPGINGVCVPSNLVGHLYANQLKQSTASG